MGGKAFDQLLKVADAFPRLLPATYQRLQAKHFAALQPLYARVATPAEAPEKPDHGDIDFIVLGHAENRYPGPLAVKDALGAKLCIPKEGNQTSHFAVLLESDGEGERFYQVDVHACVDELEWESIVFFHGYGDLGMILGLLARSVGLSLGTKGLKIVNGDADETQPESFHLSSDFTAILAFFGLSMDRWKAGFSTQRELFEWIASSRFFVPERTSDPKKREKTRRERGMYQAFLEYVHDDLDRDHDHRPAPVSPEEARGEALRYFGRAEEYDAVIKERRERKELKLKFNGHLVMMWTGLNGTPVRFVMQAVRERLAVDEIINMESELLKEVVLEEKARWEKEGKAVETAK